MEWYAHLGIAILLALGIMMFMTPLPPDWCSYDNALCPMFMPRVIGLAIFMGACVLWLYDYIGEKVNEDG